MELNERQREAVKHENGPLLIIAGAGSGKTKTLTSRVAALIERGVPPNQIVAITFTNKAASEMRERIAEKNTQNNRSSTNSAHCNCGEPFIGTFHAFCAKILRNENGAFGRTKSFTIFDADDSIRLVRKVLREENTTAKRYKPAVVAALISRVKSTLGDPLDVLGDCLANIFARYEKLLRESNAFDFDDLIEKTVRLFAKHKPILEKHQQLSTHLLVDEYQDVNPAQYELIRLLAARHKNLSVVGDDAQAIYGWRHADLQNFFRFETDWTNATIVRLEQNYRSSANIIGAAGAVIANNKIQHRKKLWTSNDAGEPIHIVTADDADCEALWIASTILTANGNLKNWNDLPMYHQQNNGDVRRPFTPSIAVLYRTNAQSRAIEHALAYHEIPYQIFGGIKFYERREIKDVVAALRLAANPADLISKERLERALPKRIHAELIDALQRAGRELSITEIINRFLIEARYRERLEQKFDNAGERIENINELIAFASQFKNLDELLERISLMQATDTPRRRNRIAKKEHGGGPILLMTMHMAKGLEFDTVFVAGVNEGFVPHERSLGALDTFEEERRLMYVAITRARKQLFLSFYNVPSRFLFEIPGIYTEVIDATGGAGTLPNEDTLYLKE